MRVPLATRLTYLAGTTRVLMDELAELLLPWSTIIVVHCRHCALPAIDARGGTASRRIQRGRNHHRCALAALAAPAHRLRRRRPPTVPNRPSVTTPPPCTMLWRR